eukprot:Platyproteum_vivax@DN3992_c0_g1_i1.p1
MSFDMIKALNINLDSISVTKVPKDSAIDASSDSRDDGTWWILESDQPFPTDAQISQFLDVEDRLKQGLTVSVPQNERLLVDKPLNLDPVLINQIQNDLQKTAKLIFSASISLQKEETALERMLATSLSPHECSQLGISPETAAHLNELEYQLGSCVQRLPPGIFASDNSSQSASPPVMNQSTLDVESLGVKTSWPPSTAFDEEMNDTYALLAKASKRRKLDKENIPPPPFLNRKGGLMLTQL